MLASERAYDIPKKDIAQLFEQLNKKILKPKEPHRKKTLESEWTRLKNLCNQNGGLDIISGEVTKKLETEKNVQGLRAQLLYLVITHETEHIDTVVNIITADCSINQDVFSLWFPGVSTEDSFEVTHENIKNILQEIVKAAKEEDPKLSEKPPTSSEKTDVKKSVSSNKPGT